MTLCLSAFKFVGRIWRRNKDQRRIPGSSLSLGISCSSCNAQVAYYPWPHKLRISRWLSVGEKQNEKKSRKHVILVRRSWNTYHFSSISSIPTAGPRGSNTCVEEASALVGCLRIRIIQVSLTPRRCRAEKCIQYDIGATDSNECYVRRRWEKGRITLWDSSLQGEA